MQCLLILYENERNFDNRSEADIKDLISRHMAFRAKAGAAILAGSGLKHTPTAKTVRAASDGERTVHDGPFAETREQLGGYYLVDVPDFEAAVALAREVPLNKFGSVEVRALLER